MLWHVNGWNEVHYEAILSKTELYRHKSRERFKNSRDAV
jgi:hypothetical protein